MAKRIYPETFDELRKLVESVSTVTGKELNVKKEILEGMDPENLKDNEFETPGALLDNMLDEAHDGAWSSRWEDGTNVFDLFDLEEFLVKYKIVLDLDYIYSHPRF